MICRDNVHSRAVSTASPLKAFTLVEVMVSVAILAILMLVTAQLISMSQRAWTRSSARLSQFREVRMAFDLLTRNLSQATLGSYWMDERQVANDPTSPAEKYVRKSELQFICGKASTLLGGSGAQGVTEGHAVFFQAPLGIVGDPENSGLANLLCARGYFVQYGSDANWRPPFLSNYQTEEKVRFRLMEYAPVAEQNDVYSVKAGEWFKDAGKEIQKSETATNRSFTRPIADNIVLLAISPRTRIGAGNKDDVSIASKYGYDSTVLDNAFSAAYPGPQGSQNLLPPLLKVVMVAIDEQTADRLGNDQQALVGGISLTSASQLEDDIKSLEQTLLNAKANYRIFSTTISLNDSD